MFEFEGISWETEYYLMRLSNMTKICFLSLSLLLLKLRVQGNSKGDKGFQSERSATALLSLVDLAACFGGVI